MIFLNQDQLNLVSPIAKDLRPSILNKTEVYNLNYLEKTKLFIASYDFLKAIISKVNDENLKKLIGTEFFKCENFYKNLLSLYDRIESEKTSFNHGAIYLKIKNIYILNYKNLDELVIFVAPLGKRVTEFNPDQDAGVIDLN